MAQGLFTLRQVNQAILQGAWSAFNPPQFVEYLVVAGGGGGGKANGGGGGAGGLLTGMVPVTAGASYTVTVGTGGAGATSFVGTSGVNSVFGAISSNGGGGGGGGSSTPPVSGGSGGGAGTAGALPGAQGISGQGNAGGNSIASGIYPGGGGGGAGTVGTVGATSGGAGGGGGAGIASAITGTVTTYAGGGGGGVDSSTAGIGGVGGGGSGGSNAVGVAGTVNTGGGGGGAGFTSGTVGGTGGSGIVIVRYSGNVQFYTGGAVTYANGYVVHKFYVTDTLAPTTPTAISTTGDYQISRSLRFNSADSAYLNRTFSLSNRKTWTWSGWVKRSNLNAGNLNLFQTYGSQGGDNDYFSLRFIGDTLGVVLYSYYPLISTQVFRDPSAWYHVVCSLDTTQATASNRLKIYINGVEVTAWSSDNRASISQNADLGINAAYQHNVGGYTGAIETFAGYMTEINFIDGQALTPSSFGETSAITGVWGPKAYTGTYGTNGFELNFSDNSNTTAATLGKDYSGNGNNFTPNNFSVTAGAGNDSLVDTPTPYGTDTGVGGTVRGNYCTINPLLNSITLSNGNLTATGTAGWKTVYGTMAFPNNGKWYFEVISGTDGNFGIVSTSSNLMGNINNYPAGGITSYTYYMAGGTAVKIVGPGNTQTSYGASFTSGDIIGVAFDADAGSLTFYKNGASQGVAFTGLTDTYLPVIGNFSTASHNLNFGQRPFAYTAPSGYKALCTQNLPTPAIGSSPTSLASKFFNPVLWTGDGASTRAITGVGFQPDFTWIKKRDEALSHLLYDAVRTAGINKALSSNATDSEANVNADATYGYLSSFDSDGISVARGTNGTVSYTNANSGTYVAWNWKANGAGSTNTSGSITSTVSASTTSGFSVVTYTGNSTSGATVGHGLGVTPSMVILKSRSGGIYDWRVYHSGLTAGYNIGLNLTGAQYQGSSGNAGYISAVASTTYTLTQSGANVLDAVNASGSTYVAYCFAPVAGYSAFGSYTGNGSADGPFVFCGFRPEFVMAKASTVAGDWWINDAKRSVANQTAAMLRPNLSNAEYTASDFNSVDILSNGFKVRTTNTGSNQNGQTYIFIAFASNPFKYSLAR